MHLPWARQFRSSSFTMNPLENRSASFVRLCWTGITNQLLCRERNFWKYRSLLLKGQDLPPVSNMSRLHVRFGEEKTWVDLSGITTNIKFVPPEIHTIVICVWRTMYRESICSQSNQLLPLHWQKAEQAGLKGQEVFIRLWGLPGAHT